MFILGIETSCDETSAAVVSEDLRVLSNVVLSQDEVHAPYGGVVPELASREHIKTIGYIVEESLQRAGLGFVDIDAFAVTQGPGLIGSLLVGLSFAKGLAYYSRKPLFPVDHLESHLAAAIIENQNIPFPALALLVSGGHTSLYLMEGKLNFSTVSRTRDDAAGEALDKVARFLELGYPGGPAIDRLAATGNPGRYRLSLPKMTDQSLDFSFSGLKTAALRLIQEQRISKGHPHFLDFLASFEQAVIRALLANLSRAARRHKPKALILCGGVASNSKLRKSVSEFAAKRSIEAYIPSPEYCTDNAAMVAALAVERIKAGYHPPPLLDLNAYPRVPPACQGG